jgi:hypothetical protein
MRFSWLDDSILQFRLEKHMRTLSIASTLCWFCAIGYSQTATGSISGAVLNSRRAPLPGMTVEAKNLATGVYYKAISSQKGEYSITQLPAGTYEVLALSLFYRPFIKKDVVVAAGQSQSLEIQLASDPAGDTLGGGAATFAAFGKHSTPPEGPTPRMPDGKPDFSGVWLLSPANLISIAASPPAELLPWAEAVVRERLLNQGRDFPSSRCLPAPELAASLVTKYVQTPTLLIRLTEDVVAAHQIYLDGRGHPSDLDPTWLGHSIGKWEGDTLVIDTVGYNDRSWLFVMVPHTEKLQVTHRLRRPDLGHLEMEITYNDPGTFKAPSKFKLVSVLAPAEDVYEMVCENNQDPEHFKK